MINFDSYPSDKDPRTLIHNIDHTRRQHDSLMLLELMSKITQQEAIVWDDNVIGFGKYRYTYKTGRQGDWPILSFIPSTENITITIMNGISDYEPLIKKIGRIKYTTNTLVLHKLSDIDKRALEKFLQTIFDDIQQTTVTMDK